jgi:hypothetical protein
MRRPRPVTLTGVERRALRVIEEALSVEDPELSLRLRGRPPYRRLVRRVRRMTGIYIAVSLAAILFGLVVGDPVTLGWGFVMLVLAPVVLVRAAEAVRRRP